MKKLVNAISLAVLGWLAIGSPAIAGGPTMTPDGMSRIGRGLRSPLVWRGNANGFRIAAQGFGNASNIRATTIRKRQYSNVPFRMAKVVVPLTYPESPKGTGWISGTTYHVTSWTAATIATTATIAGPMFPGQAVTLAGATANTRVVKQEATQAGDVATYSVDTSQTVASSSAPAAFTLPLQDVIYPFKYTYQFGLEPSYAAGLTGLTPRVPVTFAGATSVVVDPATWTASLTGSITGGVLTASGVTNTIRQGANLNAALGGALLPNNLVVGPQLTGTAGGAGAYQLGYLKSGLFVADTTLAAASEPMTALLTYLLSDPIDAGQVIAANAFYGVWETVQLDAAAASQLPNTALASSFLNRNEGYTNSNSDQIAAGTAITATSITAHASAQTGTSAIVTPATLLIQVPSSSKAVALVTDSIGYGVGSGTAGSGSYGDAEGTLLGNNGFVEIGLVENARVNDAFCACKGSDRAQNWSTSPQSVQGRLQILSLSNPTGIINEQSHNDLATAAYKSRAASTDYAAGQMLLVGGTSMYVVTGAGTSGATAPASTTPGVDIADGTLTLRYVGPGGAQTVAAGTVTASAVRSAQTMLGANMVLNQVVQGVLAGKVPLAQTLLTPGASSSDQFVTAANQTLQSGWGDGTTIRGYYNALVSALPIDLGASKVIDPNPYLEGSAALGVAGVNTGIWYWDGTAYRVTFDGTHPNSHGMVDAAQAVNSLTVPISAGYDLKWLKPEAYLRADVAEKVAA